MGPTLVDRSVLLATTSGTEMEIRVESQKHMFFLILFNGRDSSDKIWFGQDFVGIYVTSTLTDVQELKEEFVLNVQERVVTKKQQSHPPRPPPFPATNPETDPWFVYSSRHDEDTQDCKSQESQPFIVLHCCTLTE